MRIIVLINQILDPSGMTVNRRAQQVFVNRREYILNPADLSAVEAALQVRDAAGGDVTIVGLGPERVVESIRQALSMGADQGLAIIDESGAAADPAVRARLLAAAVRKAGPFDLVLTGDRVLDSDGGQIGPRVAELLDLPQLISVETVACQENRAEAIRSTETGYQRVEAPLPVLATLPPDANRPRFGTAQRIVNVYRDQSAVKCLSPADLDPTGEASSPQTRSGGRGYPTPREPGTRLEGTVEEITGRLVTALGLGA
jgi:electron transfer flavoprotein beta subunit